MAKMTAEGMVLRKAGSNDEATVAVGDHILHRCGIYGTAHGWAEDGVVLRTAAPWTVQFLGQPVQVCAILVYDGDILDHVPKEQSVEELGWIDWRGKTQL